jgi:type I restriction enzyme M protein
MPDNPRLPLMDESTSGTPMDASAVQSDELRGSARRTRRRAVKTANGLTATIKNVRDTMRKGSGLSTDLDRMPQLIWLLFLKLLDDFELAQQEEWGEQYAPILSPHYRWRDWAAVGSSAYRRTGDDLIRFVNEELFPHLREVSGTGPRDIRTVVGTIFQGTDNRIRSGYVLREVVDELTGIDFNSSDDIHTLSLFYETMLQQMRDAAGENGEFYTPRPVVRFIVDRLAPRLGERVLDPACGTGGFLVETYERLKEQARDPEQRRRLEDNLMGIEKQPMPYLLAITNLLLHGIERPNIAERNALQRNINHIQGGERVHVIATNPPFGGAEEPGILSNFPLGKRTQETAILFVQYVMAMLKRPGGRCGIVLPNGFLFGDKVAAEVKKQLLERFNLHTIVRLPNGVFAPYTDIPTNLLFFEAGSPGPDGFCTREIWYYEHPLPEGRRSYTKTQPLQFEEFECCRAWWDNREENDRAWRVPIERVVESGYNLEFRNPHRNQNVIEVSPHRLLDSILQKEQRIARILADIKRDLGAA